MKNKIALLVSGSLTLAIIITALILFNRPYENIGYAQTLYTINSVSGTTSFTAGQDTTTNLDIVEDTRTVIREVGEIYVDLQVATTGFDAVHTTGDVLSVRLWVKIDGTNYRQVSVNTYTDNSITNHVYLDGFVIDKAFKVTAAVSADRGAYDVKYRYNWHLW